jgi:hypothetical protein
MSDKSNSHVRTIYFTPAADGDVEISVAASGLGDDVELVLSGTSAGEIVRGKMQTSVIGGQRTCIEVTFAEPFVGPIELSASAVAGTTVQEEG